MLGSWNTYSKSTLAFSFTYLSKSSKVEKCDRQANKEEGGGEGEDEEQNRKKKNRS